MKTYSITAIFALSLSFQSSNAQVSQGFENGLTNLYNNCWQFSSTISLTSTVNKGGPISGTESMITLPPVNEGVKDYLVTPYLDLSSLSLKVSFKYALNTKLAGSAYRLIRIGLIDKFDDITLFDSIHLDKTSAVNTITYNQTFTLTSPVSKRFFIEFSGNTGDGNSRLIFDDLSLSADYYYGENGYNACNAAPVAVDDVYLGILGTIVAGNVKSNDREPDEEASAVILLSQPVNGIVSVSNDGSFTFRPNLLFSGTKAEFTYQLNDNGYTPLVSNVAKVTIDFSFSLLSFKLKNFNGQLNNTTVSLQWMVSNNESLSNIEIEESRNGKDFFFVSRIMSTAKAGEQEYRFNRKNAATSETVYRLKLVGVDNQVSYSNALALRSGTAMSSFIKHVSAKSGTGISVNFQSDAEKLVGIRITDLTGKVLFVCKKNIFKGTNMISCPVNGSLSKGNIYVVQLSDGTANYAVKLMMP
jgi:hypothetical protein